MATTSGRLLLWSPRILGVLVSMFIGMFALDAFNEGKPLLLALPNFLIHSWSRHFDGRGSGPWPSSASPPCTRRRCRKVASIG
jgi:hypothetical protein